MNGSKFSKSESLEPPTMVPGIWLELKNVGKGCSPAVKALIVANEFLEAQVEELRADVSKGYARGYYHGRFKTYTG